MGDRFDISIKCAKCGKINEVWYAPTCNSDIFECKYCGAKNFITAEFKAKLISDVTKNDIIDGFLMASNASWTDEELERMAEEKLEELKKYERGE